MRESAYRLCETDAETSSELTSTHTFARDEAKHDTVVLAGEGGFRIWDNAINEMRSFVLFTGCTTLPDDQSTRSGPVGTRAAVTNILILPQNNKDEESATQVIFTLWQHAQVFHSTLSCLENFDEPVSQVSAQSMDPTHSWFFNGSRVCHLVSDRSSKELGEAICLVGDRDGLVASGSDRGILSVWKLWERQDREVEPLDDDLIGQVTVGESFGKINDIAVAQVGNKKHLVVGGDGYRINVFDAEKLEHVLSIPCGFGHVTALCIFSSNSMIQSQQHRVLQVDANKQSGGEVCLAAGFSSGVISVWNYSSLLLSSERGQLTVVEKGSVVSVLNYSNSAITKLTSTPVQLRSTGIGIVAGSEHGELLLFSPASVIGEEGTGWTLARATKVEGKVNGIEVSDSGIIVSTPFGLQQWQVADIEFREDFGTENVNRSELQNVSNANSKFLETSHNNQDPLSIGEKEYDEENTNDADPNVNDWDSMVQRITELEEVDDYQDTETQSEFEQPTPAPEAWTPRPNAHPLEKLHHLQANLARADETNKPTLDDEQVESLRLSTGNLGMRWPVEKVKVFDANDADDMNLDLGEATCYNGLRDVDMPPLPLSDLHEPRMNSTTFLQRELARLKEEHGNCIKVTNKTKRSKTHFLNSETQAANKVYNSPNATGLEEPLRQLEMSEPPKSAIDDEFKNLVPISRGEGSDPVVVVHRRRSVAPQVSEGWKYVSLLERLPELCKKHAQRRGVRSESLDDDSEDALENQQGGGKENASGTQLHRHRKGNQSNARRSSQRSNFEWLPSPDPIRPGQQSMFREERPEESATRYFNSNNSGRSTSSSSSGSSTESDLPWFYQQQQQASESQPPSNTAEFYLTRSKDGVVQFHNFHSLSTP